MINEVSSNISSFQIFRATNAFNQAKVSPKAEEIKPLPAEETKEEVSSINPVTTAEKMQNKIIDAIRDDLTNINEDITDEDIRYGLTFGRSVLVDCSA